MTDAQPVADESREALRRRWLAHAAAAFDLMFDPHYQEQLVTLDQREQRACELGRDLTAWLLQQHVNTDAQARSAELQPPVCPKCGRPGQRVTGPEEPLPQRRLTTLIGEVALNREQWRCTTCRVVFFPLGPQARAGHRGDSPAVLRKAVRQAGKAASFKDASEDLRELLELAISPSHLHKLTERVGREWAAARDADVQAFRENKLPAQYAQPPRVATVMVDGGRVQTRQGAAGRGVSGPGWQEVKVACYQTLSSSVHVADPQPEPPAKFLDPVQAARLAAEVKARGGSARSRSAQADPTPRRHRRRKARRRDRPRKLVRTVVASLADSEAFGWQMAAEVQRRGLDRAQRKGYICDGQRYNWTLFEMHLVAVGFIGILDFLHLLAYLYAAAQAVAGKGSAAAWALYERWLRWAWSGRVMDLLTGLRAGHERLGPPPPGCPDDDPRKVVADAVGYVENNRGRMDYPRYRRLGLPISSAPVESVIKQLNRRVKGTEKFWVKGGAEALLQVRAAYLSEDGRAERSWARPRPYAHAAGASRLRPAA